LRPAASVIVFTVSAGAGYSLLALTAIVAPFGLLERRATLVAILVGVALALILAGLSSSTLHLGRPGRAWRAFSRWRSSWLAREGIAAIVGLPPAIAFGALAALGRSQALAIAAGLAAALLAVVTLFCTAMIYASLTPIARWRSPWTAPAYFALALMSGALLLAALAGPGFGPLAALTIGAAWAVKSNYWRAPGLSPKSDALSAALGVAPLGAARLLWSPDSPSAFVRAELAASPRIERDRLARAIVHVALFAAPLTLTLLAPLSGLGLAHAEIWLATGSATVGLAVERWLFFVEAGHACGVYYR
jgi:DMSO reductase anchor subunit